jgi:hypothetical protein
MNNPTQSQLDAARRMLARETGKRTSAEDRAAAARAVYDAVSQQLATLVGVKASRALFARSVKLAARDNSICLLIAAGIPRGESLGDELFARLRAVPPEVATEAAEELFATLLALLGTLIGDRLTAKVLRDSLPPVNATAPEKETK